MRRSGPRDGGGADAAAEAAEVEGGGESDDGATTHAGLPMGSVVAMRRFGNYVTWGGHSGGGGEVGKGRAMPLARRDFPRYFCVSPLQMY